METIAKRRFLIGIIVILIVINISALATIFYTSKIQSRNISPKEEIQEKTRMNGLNHFFKAELQLTDEQFLLFQEINSTNLKNTHLIIKTLDELRFEMMNEVVLENPDLKKLDRIASDIGKMHYKLKQNTINHFIELKKICNTDQQEILQNMFFQMIQDQDQGKMRNGNRGEKRRLRNRHQRNGN